jgi:hypothetical protein
LSKADATDPAILDALAAPGDPDAPNYRSMPHAVPDHGADGHLDHERKQRSDRRHVEPGRHDADCRFRLAPATIAGLAGSALMLHGLFFAVR